MGAHFFAALVVDGALAGTLYALVALSFVVVYRASRMINFAVGEWVMLASRFVTFGLHALGLGLLGALAVGCAGMAGLGVAFNRVVLRRLVGQPLISVIMVTLGLGALVRGAAALAFGGVPAAIPLPVLASPIVIGGLPIAGDKLAAAAASCTAVVAWVFHGSRTGVALRAIADDQQAAMSAGIDLHRYFAITWALMGVVSVLAGTLWTLVAGGGLGIVLVGLKVFPIVIIGGLDSIPGTGVGALGGGVLESPSAGFFDPPLRAGRGAAAATSAEGLDRSQAFRRRRPVHRLLIEVVAEAERRQRSHAQRGGQTVEGRAAPVEVVTSPERDGALAGVRSELSSEVRNDPGLRAEQPDQAGAQLDA